MKLYLEKKVIAGFVVILSVMVWLAVYSFSYNQKFTTTSVLINHTNEVLFHSQHLLTTIKDIETNQRGFVITNDSSFLETFAGASDSINKHLSKLILLTRGNEKQQERLRKLKIVNSEKIKLTKKYIEARNNSFEEAKRNIETNKSRQLMAFIMALVTEIQEAERLLLRQRIAERERSYERFSSSLTTLLGSVVVILLLVFMAIYISFKARIRSEHALIKASLAIKDLYENAPCGYYSLDINGTFVEMNATMLSWLGYQRDEIIERLTLFDIVTASGKNIFMDNFPRFKKEGIVKNLEFDFIRKDGSTFQGAVSASAIYDEQGKYQKSRSTVFDVTERRIAEERSRQLNQELEAFTYSVSHDLRSPLRSINGYSKILTEDYSDRLDSEGNRILNVIMSNATKMGQLIDDLLDFSRVGKKEIAKFPYNAEHLVRALVVELQEQEHERKINVKIMAMEPSMGDVVLIRQVWQNLISNAFKYTQKNAVAEIEIGSNKVRDEVVYHIKDNGVGFDMQYVGKLFGVFQRLHKIPEFEGTGVGLAIVHRIVTRHGGRIWADAGINKGATFFFSLPLVN